MTNAKPLNSMATANHFGISTSTLQTWTRYQGFPANCRTRDGRDVFYDIAAVTAWLKSRPVSNRGARPTWLALVGHSAA